MAGRRFRPTGPRPHALVLLGNSLPVALTVTKAGGVPIKAERTVQATPRMKHHIGKEAEQSGMSAKQNLPSSPLAPNPRANALNPEPGL